MSLGDFLTFQLNGASTGTPSPEPIVQVKISDNGDGTFTFEIQQLEGGTVGDISAFWFDIGNESLIGSLNAAPLPSPTGADTPQISLLQDDDSIRDLGDGDTLQGVGYGGDGGFDVGVQVNQNPDKLDDYLSLKFVLSSNSPTQSLTLGDFSNMDFAIRIQSVGADTDGDGDGDGSGSWKILGTSTPPAEPALDIVKEVTGVTGGTPDGHVDSAGDVINYAITVDNTGNVTLTDVTVTDPYADAGSIAYVSGDTDADGRLDVDEIWTYTAAHTVTQLEIDTNGGGDGMLENVATADSKETPQDTDDAAVKVVYDPRLDIVKEVAGVTGGTPDGHVDSAGDVINYAITVDNTGNVTLTDVTVTDPYADDGSIAYVSGDTDADGRLDVDEIWTYTAAHTVTQLEIDTNGGDDGMLENVATADSKETPQDTDDAAVKVVYDPRLDIVKEVAGVTGGTMGGEADSAGDVINYAITVKNTGNVTLTGVTVTDPYADASVAYVSGDDGDQELEVGETWTYTAAHTVSQAEIDSNGGGNGVLENVATADSNQTPEDTDDAFVNVVYNPDVDIEKYVRVNQDGTWTDWLDADSVSGPIADQDDAIEFQFVVTNTGNVTLTDVTLADSMYDLNGAAEGSAFSFGTLGVGETQSYVLTGASFQPGQHTNTGTVTTTQGATDNDDANYYGLFDGPGVRTPGFWSNNGLQFWDGKAGNETKTGPNFPLNELAYDPDDAGSVPSNSSVDGDEYIVLNDDGDGVVEDGELGVLLSDAVNFLNASVKQQQDGRWMLARDAVATELNLLAGNPSQDLNPSTDDPQQLLAEAVKWLDLYGDTNHDNWLSTQELTGTGRIATSSSQWTTAIVGNEYAANVLHPQLNSYNNDGTVFGVQYARDGDLQV
jgi:uncharacterized repeat protein (TIGR01451 family)